MSIDFVKNRPEIKQDANDDTEPPQQPGIDMPPEEPPVPPVPPVPDPSPPPDTA